MPKNSYNLSQSNSPNYSQTYNIANGEAGAKQTLSLMRRIVLASMADLNIRRAAMEKTAFIPQKDYMAEACRLLTYVRDDVRYVRDIRGIEVLQSPSVTMDIGGDCDDKSILLAALLHSTGHRCRFIAISMMPGSYQHVWVQAWLNRRWLDLEPTEPIECGARVPTTGVIKELTLEI